MNAKHIITASLVIAATALAPAAALAKHGADDGPNSGDDNGGQQSGNSGGGGNKNLKKVTGTCTGNSTAKLKAKPDDGRLETEFEVDQNQNGVKWQVRIRRNGKLVVKTSRTTKAPSGSFEVERKIFNPAGKDRITARATSPSGEVCTASLTI